MIDEESRQLFRYDVTFEMKRPATLRWTWLASFERRSSTLRLSLILATTREHVA